MISPVTCSLAPTSPTCPCHTPSWRPSPPAWTHYNHDNNASPLIPSVVDVLKAKGSARERLLHRRRDLLKRQKGHNSSSTGTVGPATKAKKSLALGGNRADTLRKMR